MAGLLDRRVLVVPVGLQGERANRSKVQRRLWRAAAKPPIAAGYELSASNPTGWAGRRRALAGLRQRRQRAAHRRAAAVGQLQRPPPPSALSPPLPSLPPPTACSPGGLQTLAARAPAVASVAGGRGPRARVSRAPRLPRRIKLPAVAPSGSHNN